MTKQHQMFKVLTFSAFALSMGIASPAFAESTGQYIDDATITAKVKEAILHDSQLKVMQVSVDTTDGTVVLSGAVDNNAQQLEAVKVASEVKGVVNVTDNLALRVANDD